MKVNKLKDWFILITAVITISGACFAGTSKIIAILLQEQFNEIYSRLNCVETNLKITNERINGIDNTVNRIWYKIK